MEIIHNVFVLNAKAHPGGWALLLLVCAYVKKFFLKKKSHSLILCCKYRLKGLLHLLRIENSTLSTINCKQ